MEFEEILNQWEQLQEKKKRLPGAGKAGKQGEAGRAKSDFSRHLNNYLDKHPGWDHLLREKEADEQHFPGEERSKLLRMAPQAFLDLHGMTRDEAWSALERFFTDSRRRELRKVLIIHGKGNHSGNRAVLPELVSTYLRRSPHAGESGKADRQNGGSGATWVILRDGRQGNR